ncbi:UNVERIFIED_CONTAM: hypothetical protein GTU68_044555 [Idotea baltica]|nr:hypothetical protein [Idotea baltica]
MPTEIHKVLLVEDDANLGALLKEYLDFKGFNVTYCSDGELGLEAFNKDVFSICILDVMMPKMDGFTLAKNIRSKDKDTPILFLTAKSMKEDKIEGFKIGADDYMTKPFSMEELQLRMDAILRRIHKSKPANNGEPFQIGDFSFDYNQQILTTSGGEEKHLTTKECALLKMLCESMNDVMLRENALKAIWNEDSYFTARSMDVYITKLRKYLKSDTRIEIKNIHGKGYKLISKEMA